jgi:SAM-dependent methyltransferase
MFLERQPHPDWVAYEPDLLPSRDLMRREGIDVLEEWFRWAEEWGLLLRLYGGLVRTSAVLEIGCGLGRIAYPLRYLLGREGSYDGFDVCEYKIRFLEGTFTRAHPNFRFAWADVRNTEYNPGGRAAAVTYTFPYPDGRFDLVFAASVFTHMAPDTAERYIAETTRVLRPGGRCVFSFFLLDNYDPDRARPTPFAGPSFDFDHAYGSWGKDFAIARPDNPELMTAYRLSLIERFASAAGLRLEGPPLPGCWSGRYESWVGAQELVVFAK